MQQVTTDDEATQFLREWAQEPGKYTDSHAQSEAFRGAQHHYEFARKALSKDVQGALQCALDLAGGH
jgi:hypothetical protein